MDIEARRDEDLEEELACNSAQQTIKRRVLDYYEATTADYKLWSKNFNMHFGYWRWGLNPFRREPMLNELNRQVLKRVDLPTDRPARLVDLGGGTGATARAAVELFPDVCVDVVTIAPTQVMIGNALNAAAIRGEGITMHCGDYTETKLLTGRFDGACMIESACHAQGPVKAVLLQEAFRLLRPGAKLVMVDAMLRHGVPAKGIFNRIAARIYRIWCQAWAVPELCRMDLLPHALVEAGFAEVTIEDWSWRVAPSIAHIPVLAASFTIAEVVKSGARLPIWKWRHIVASFLTPFLGMWRNTLTYAVVTAKKPDHFEKMQ